MRYLVDTHLLLWSLYAPSRLPEGFSCRLESAAVAAYFSAASMAEVAIKLSTGKLEFRVDLRSMRDDLLDNDFTELPILTSHAFILSALPLRHKDPFDRLLIAQAQAEGLVLLTVDGRLAEYGSVVELLR